MNSLILLADELSADGSAFVTGQRAKYLSEFHDLSTQREIKIGVFAGQRGTANVISVTDNEYRFQCQLTQQPLARENISLVVAAPRPQILKRVIQTATLLGVKEINFVKSELSQKSYMQSSYFKEEILKVELIKALEQACDTVPPIIKKWYSLEKYLNEHKIEAGLKVYGDEKGDKFPLGKFNSAEIAVGPEAGWSNAEKQMLVEANYFPVTLGDRVLRVDIATTALTSIARERLI